ncbi:MAG: hypothetical protein QXY90_04945 [Candidatus Anstonellales archaeon]
MNRIKGSPVDKIGTIKGMARILKSNHETLMLPTPPFPNVYPYGPVSKDLKRCLYQNDRVQKFEKTFHMDESIRQSVLEECENKLGSITMALIKQLVENYAKGAGRDFTNWIRREGILSSKKSKGEDQIETSLLNPGKDRSRWVYNPRLKEHLSKKQFTSSINLPPFKVGSTEKNTADEAAYSHCYSRLQKLAIHEKQKLPKTRKEYKFLIDRLADIDNFEEDNEVLYVGYVKKRGETYYFIDAFYNKNLNDEIEIEYFDGIETKWVYAMIGELLDKHYVVPHGMLKINRINEKNSFSAANITVSSNDN